MKTKIIGKGVYYGAYEYYCVFGYAAINYIYGAWRIKVAWEYDHLFNVSFKKHTEAIAHLDKECYKYIQEAIKYLK